MPEIMLKLSEYLAAWCTAHENLVTNCFLEATAASEFPKVTLIARDAAQAGELHDQFWVFAEKLETESSLIVNYRVFGPNDDLDPRYYNNAAVRIYPAPFDSGANHAAKRKSA